MLRYCLLVTIVASAIAQPARDLAASVKQVYDTEKKIAEDGFTSETHHVVTSDGYILEINRIPRGRNDKDDGSPKPVVFLMHGLQGSAISYLTIGPEKSMGYNLADAGFDVWMGNARGVLNSRNHISIDPDNSRSERLKFFDFTFEEIAVIDVPTMIDYVLEYTGNEKLHFIGHSQGGTVFLILNSVKPEYNQKFASVHLLAGVGYQNYFPSSAIEAVALRTDLIYTFTQVAGIAELFGPEWNEMGECDDDGSATCDLFTIKDILTPMFGEIEVLAGASLKQFAHYGQNIRDKSFRKWNYGILNFMMYGSRNPPSYNLASITADVTMHYSLSDILLDERDVLSMAEAMPNTKVRKVARESFKHTDYTVAADAKELVTDYIIDDIKNYQ